MKRQRMRKTLQDVVAENRAFLGDKKIDEEALIEMLMNKAHSAEREGSQISAVEQIIKIKGYYASDKVNIVKSQLEHKSLKELQDMLQELIAIEKNTIDITPQVEAQIAAPEKEKTA